MINFIQLDPNGLCNAGCWFCPVSTLGNPKNQINQMDINLFDKIISEIDELEYFDVFPSCGDETLPFGAIWLNNRKKMQIDDVKKFNTLYSGNESK